MNRHRYEDDVLAWTEEQVSLLRAGDVTGLDFANLAEEIESLGISQKRELRNRLAVLIQHLLKYRFQPELRCGSWLGTISEQRGELEGLIKDSPSLAKLLAGSLEWSYDKGRRKAVAETGLLHVPEVCPFTITQIQDPDWLPD